MASSQVASKLRPPLLPSKGLETGSHRRDVTPTQTSALLCFSGGKKHTSTFTSFPTFRSSGQKSSKSPIERASSCRNLSSNQHICLRPLASSNFFTKQASTFQSREACQPKAAIAGTANTAVREEAKRPGRANRDPVVGPGETRTCDVVVVGSGIGGLSCAGLLARYGEDVVVCESHDIAGGAAHSFEIKGYEFDSGPSLFSGLSSKGSQANPLAQVLDALGESVPCIQYDAWMCYLPEGDVLSKIGPDDFKDVLMKLSGPEAVEEWTRLLENIKPLSGAAMALPPAALRADPAVALTVLRFAPALLQTFAQGGPAAALGAGKLMGPFTQLLDDAQIKTPFLRNWCNLLAFLLSGVPADGTIAAEMVYMFGEWYKPGCTLEYPVGGVGALIDALVRGLEKYRGKLSLNSHVETVLVENGKAVGVKLRNGGTLRARKAVVSNASSWDTLKLLPEGSVPAEWRKERAGTPECGSFMHLHLGIDKKDLPEDLGIHHIVVNTWEGGVDGPQNVVLISVPSVLDPSLAPPGKHVLHAYTPGTEPYEIWEGLDRKSREYKQLKEERSEVLWKAVEKALGPGFDRSKVEVSLIGTPLTHERYLRRHRGSYGPAIKAGQGSFPGPGTPIPGLYCCGDQTFPGIGVPAVAGSGVMVANTLAPVWEHWKLLDAIGL